MSYPRRSSLLQDVSRAIVLTAIAVTLVVAPRVVFAHAVLVHSSPAEGTAIIGPDLPITLKFNSRVDASRSTLLLTGPDGQSKPMTIDKQVAPDTLSAQASGLIHGKYAIRWQVLAVDGHITRGQISFEVK